MLRNANAEKKIGTRGCSDAPRVARNVRGGVRGGPDRSSLSEVTSCARTDRSGPAAVSAERPRARREGGGSTDTEHRPAIETRRGRREEGAPGGTCVRRHRTDCMCVRC